MAEGKGSVCSAVGCKMQAKEVIPTTISDDTRSYFYINIFIKFVASGFCQLSSLRWHPTMHDGTRLVFKAWYTVQYTVSILLTSISGSDEFMAD